MYSRPAVGSEYIRPAGSAGCSMLCCSLPCGRREWRELRHIWKNFIGLHFIIKTLFQVWCSHYKDQMVIRPSYLFNGNTHAGKIIRWHLYILRQPPGFPANFHYGCWWPGNIRSQGIKRHGADTVCTEKFCCSCGKGGNKNAEKSLPKLWNEVRKNISLIDTCT